jgi:DNA-binding NarL/FixJ family response regulator
MTHGGGALRRGSILIVDDDPLVRRILAETLADAGYATSEAESGEDALRSVRDEPPALVLLDVHLPGMCGYEVCRLLRDEFGDGLPVIFVSGERTESFDRVAGLLLGANDYVIKPFATDELLARVQVLLRSAHSPTARSLAARLTPRELEILRLLAAGLSPAEIAHRLVISPKTVGAHVERLYLKVGVQTRAQAIALAYRDDLLVDVEPAAEASATLLGRAGVRSAPR